MYAALIFPICKPSWLMMSVNAERLGDFGSLTLSAAIETPSAIEHALWYAKASPIAAPVRVTGRRLALTGFLRRLDLGARRLWNRCGQSVSGVPLVT